MSMSVSMNTGFGSQFNGGGNVKYKLSAGQMYKLLCENTSDA